jgi:hypothetical protein
MLPDSYWLALKEVAQRQGRNPSEVIREAVAAYVAGRSSAPLPSFVGAASGKFKDIASQADARLREP